MKSPFLPATILAAALLLSGCCHSISQAQHSPAVLGSDADLQKITDSAVSSGMAKLHPKRMVVILADPKTGEVLAMTARRSGNKEATDDAVTWMFEPGSTFKIVTVEAALNEGVVNEKTLINCDHGQFPYGGKVIKDHVGYGNLTPIEILEKSSNIGAAKMALMLKDSVFADYVQRFGFGRKTGVDLPDENPGLVNPPSKWDGLSKVRMSYGQSVAVTPIQLTMAYCAIANGGKLMGPWFLNSPSKRPPAKRVISGTTASIVRKALLEAVSDQGTAPLARVDGMTVAGKTGTSEVISTRGDYQKGKYITSFAGYFPAEKPRYVCVVVVDQASVPTDENYGGMIAAPIFAEIARKAATAKHPLHGIKQPTP